MRKTLLVGACSMILIMGLVFVSCKKKEEQVVSQAGPAGTQPAMTEQEVLDKITSLQMEAEKLEQAVKQGAVQSTEAAKEQITSLEQQKEDLNKKVSELGTAALTMALNQLTQKMNSASRAVEMDKTQEDEGKPKTPAKKK